jgi:hypothetical protein
MNVRTIEAALALDHMKRRAHPPLNRARRRRARKILKVAAEFYAGERTPTAQVRAIASAITREAERASRHRVS